MTAGRGAFLFVAALLLIVSITLAVQGWTGLWFTAVAMGIAIFNTLRSGLKEHRRTQGSSAPEGQ